MSAKIKVSSIIKTILILSFLGFVGFEVYKSTQESGNQGEVKGFFSADLLETTEIQILAGTNQLLLVKKDQDWKIMKPIQEFADIDLITTWLQQIVNSQTEAVPLEYKSLDWEKYGLTDPLARIYFKLKDKSKVLVEVSATKSFNEQFYLKYTLDNSSQLLISDLPWLDLILKKPMDFVSSKKIMNFEIDNVFEIKLNDFGIFVKEDGLWTFKGEKDIDPAKATGLLQNLKDLKIIGLESNEATISKKVIFNLELVYEDKTNDVIQVFEHFKDCSLDTVVERCQLMRVVSSSYPFWVPESKIKPIISKVYFQKIK